MEEEDYGDQDDLDSMPSSPSESDLNTGKALDSANKIRPTKLPRYKQRHVILKPAKYF
jgi:hypothetical protein